MAITEQLHGNPPETVETLRTPYASFAVYRPRNVLSNADIERWHIQTKSGRDITADYLLEKLGVERRYVADEHETAIDMGVNVAKAAIQDPDAIDTVLVSTSYPLGINVSGAISEQLNIHPSFHLDIHAACSGFTRGLAYMKENENEFVGKKVLFIATEKYSHTLADLRHNGSEIDQSMAQTIFSDGAVAMLFTQGEGFEILAAAREKLPPHTDNYIRMPIDPEKMIAPFISEPVPQSPSGNFEQDGPHVYGSVKQFVPRLNNALVQKTGLIPPDIKYTLSHQGSGGILQGLVDTMPEYTIYRDIEEGNFSSASIPKAWARAQREGQIQPGDKLLLSGFGAGLYAASVIIQVG